MFVLLKNFYLILFKKKKFSIILNYHRIGDVDPKNPFHRLHTVSLSTFKLQIKICSLIGNFVSLNDIENSNLKSKLNFCITFDDVSSSAYDALNWLNKNKTPFAICPCQQITENSLGWRDKVYFIEKFLEKKDILNSIKEKFPLVNFDADESFYSLSKNLQFDQLKMIKDIVDPLYQKIHLRDENNEKNYFTVDDLIKIKKEFRYMEIVNHSLSHAKLTELKIQELYSEIDNCDKFLSSFLGTTPKYFAVPFGGFDNRLCIGLNEVARLKKKKAILWVANRLNLDIGYKPNKIRQLGRFHTHTSVIGLCLQILVSFLRPHFLEDVVKKIPPERSKNEIKFNPENSKILAFEDLSRPTKNYSGCLSFLKNFYIANPFLNSGNHTIAELQNDRIMAIGQNLVLPFNGLKSDKVVNFFGNWRSVTGATKIGAAAILGKALKEYNLTISYKPSKIIESSFVKMGWHCLLLKKFTYNLPIIKGSKINSNLKVKYKLEEKDEINQFNSSCGDIIQLILSKNLLRWRVENYSLAKPVYFFLDDNGEKAFVVAQYNDSEILLLDQRFSSIEVLKKIIEEIFKWSKKQNLIKLVAETSCIQTQNLFEKILPEKKIKNDYCYFAPRGIFHKLKDKKIIITPLSSDIFLR